MPPWDPTSHSEGGEVARPAVTKNEFRRWEGAEEAAVDEEGDAHPLLMQLHCYQTIQVSAG